MIRTRNMATRDELFLYLDQKFEELKGQFVSEIKEELKKEMQSLLNKYEEKVEALESTVSMLQQHVTNLKEQNEIMYSRVDDNEQYGRRLCLRLGGIPSVDNETSDDVLKKVRDIIAESKVPDEVIDRAHRIGATYTDRDSNVKCQSVIVRFTTFRHRTIIYRARKELKNNVSVHLDLTKNRYAILKEARQIVEKNEKIKFVYADINCRMKVHPKVGKECFFDSCKELREIIDSL